MNDQLDEYYPESEAKGTFRYAKSPDEKKDYCGIDDIKLDFTRQFQYDLNSGDSFGVHIIKNDWMVDEYYTYNVLTGTSFDIWSGTKSFVSLAYACLFDESGGEIDYSSKVYDFLPDHNLSGDNQRLGITFEHLLSMTSGLRGISSGGVGMGVPYSEGEFEYALGSSQNRRGFMCDIIAEPGTRYDYCDAGYTLLAYAFIKITGEEIKDYITRKIFSKLGISSAHWDLQGGYGKMGPHTNGHTGLHITVRDLARVGYLLLKEGMWSGERILPASLFKKIEETPRVNPRYGIGFWKNTDQRLIQNAPGDTYFMNGFRSNRCYVIPSLKMVVTRAGSGPAQWNEHKFLGDILGSII